MLSWFTEITVRRSISLFPSSSQNRVRSKNCVTRFCDQSEYHHCCTSVSLSVWFIRTSLVPCLCYSKSQEWPTTARKPASILRKLLQRSEHILLYCRSLPTLDKRTLTWRWFCRWSAHSHSILFLNFWISSRNAQRRESCEDFPLELRLHTIDAIKFLDVAILGIPFFHYPSCVRVTSQVGHTKHWVGETLTWEVVFSEMNCCLKSGIHEHSPNSQIHIQIFHWIAWLFSIFLPDHGEVGFKIVRCVRRHVEIVVPCRFRIILTFLVNWRTGSVCNGVLPSFTVLGNKFFFVVPSSSRRIVRVFWISFFLMRRVAALEVSILDSHLRRRSCVEWAWFNTHPAVGFRRSYRHLRNFRCNRTRRGGRTYRNKSEDKVITAGRDLDTTLSSSFWFWILFAILEQFVKLKFLVQQMELKWLIFNKWRR